MRSLIAFLAIGALVAGCGPPLGPAIHIDWIDFVLFDGITYVSSLSPDAGRALTDDDLGPHHRRVQFKLADRVRDPSYRPRDGDAAFLEPATPVHQVKDYVPRFRLAARLGGGLHLYEADTNPKARRGEDLLDLRGKVAAIAVNSPRDGRSQLARIDDPAAIAGLADLVLSADVDQSRAPQQPAAEEQRYFIAFHLRDGTRVTRSFDLVSSELWRGIWLPPAFGAAVEEAVRRSR